MFAIRLDKRYVSPHFDGWVDMYFNMFDGKKFDEEVWDRIRIYSFYDAPRMETVYQSFLLSNLRKLIRDFIINEIPELANNFDDWYYLDFDNGTPSETKLSFEVIDLLEFCYLIGSKGDKEACDINCHYIRDEKTLLLLVRQLKLIHHKPNWRESVQDFWLKAIKVFA